MRANPDISQALFAAKNQEKLKELADKQGLWLACEQKGSHAEAWSSISSYRGVGTTIKEAAEAHFERLATVTSRIEMLFALWESGLKPVEQKTQLNPKDATQ
jgi:hypothetical protein